MREILNYYSPFSPIRDTISVEQKSDAFKGLSNKSGFTPLEIFLQMADINFRDGNWLVKLLFE